MKKEKERSYIAVNVPREWGQYFEELLERPDIKAQLELDHYRKTYSGLGVWIIRKFLIENTKYRFKHINTLDNHITIQDRKLRRIIDVYVRDKTKDLWCEYCGNTDCEHVSFSYTIPEVRETLSNKGWKLPDVE